MDSDMKVLNVRKFIMAFVGLRILNIRNPRDPSMNAEGSTLQREKFQKNSSFKLR